MTNSIHQAREALGNRLRDIRKDARLTGRSLALLAGWDGSKVSKIEHGKQTPSEDDIREWCEKAGAVDQVPELVAMVRHIEATYMEWRRSLGAGTRRRQQAFRALETKSGVIRWYEPLLVPGLLHTAEYATAVMRRVIDFYGIPDDLADGVAARMERQQILYKGDRRFHFIVAQQALVTRVGDVAVMMGQMDRLLAVMSLHRVSFGIVPAAAEYRVPTNQFIVFDDRAVNIETVSAELAITQPREIALYLSAFAELHKQAMYGKAARAMVVAALRDLQSEEAGSQGSSD